MRFDGVRWDVIVIPTLLSIVHKLSARPPPPNAQAANTGLNLGEVEEQRKESIDKEEGEDGSAYYKM